MSAREYLAIIHFVPGGSTFHRGTEEAATVALKAARRARRDWQSLFDIPPKHVWTVPVYDVTDHDNVIWDASGVFDETTGEAIPRHSTERPTA